MDPFLTSGMDSPWMEESDFSDYANILIDEGFLSDCSTQLRKLQGGQDPKVAWDLVSGFFDDSEEILEQLAESLEADPIEYTRVNAHLRQFLALCSKCRLALATMKQEFSLLKTNLKSLLRMRGGACENNLDVMRTRTFRQTMNQIYKRSQGPVFKDDYKELHPGRSLRTDLIGRHSGCNRCKELLCRYTVDVLDAKDGTEVEHSYCVFLVPPQRSEEWLFTSTRGLWQVLADTKTRRLILVAMYGCDHDNDVADMKTDVSPMISYFLPLGCTSDEDIKYLTENNRIIFRRTLALVESSTTGPILVEDVAISKSKKPKPTGDQLECYRRLSFKRNPNMIQSEARLSRPVVTSNNKGKKKLSKKVPLKMPSEEEVFNGLNVDHNCLTNDYHEGMIAAFVVIANKLEQWLAAEEEIRVMILGLGAGLLPMFVHNHIPVTDIQVVELDQMVGELAKCHFGFVEDERMKLQIGDGVDAVKAIAAASSPNCGASPTDSRLHVLIIDTDSEDPSDGSSCPAPECLEDDFLLAGRQALHDGGMLVVNVVASSRKYHADAKAQLKKFFAEVFVIELEKDVCVVLIAMAQPRKRYDQYSNMRDLVKLTKICAEFSPWGRGPNLEELVLSLKLVN